MFGTGFVIVCLAFAGDSVQGPSDVIELDFREMRIPIGIPEAGRD